MSHSPDNGAVQARPALPALGEPSPRSGELHEPPLTHTVRPVEHTGKMPASLWERYHKTGPGDASENELVKAYLPLVKTLVDRLAINLPPHVDQQHLYSAGLIGLLEGLRHFDPAAGTTFESYARIRIRGAMLDELRKMDWAPRSVHAKARKLQQTIVALEQTIGRVPDDTEVAGALHLTLSDYHALLEEVRPATFICLDACSGEPAGDDATDRRTFTSAGGLSAHESLEDTRAGRADETVWRAELSSLIAKRIEQLPDLYRKILALYYFEGLRVSEIAEATGFCPAHICQTHTKAILAIRAFVERYERCGQGLESEASAPNRPFESQASSLPRRGEFHEPIPPALTKEAA